MPHPDAKTALARALRDALTTTPLSKVTISGLTRAAGVTRQAFYYHFSDIRDLTAWVFKREIGDQIVAHSTPENWSDGLLSMLVCVLLVILRRVGLRFWLLLVRWLGLLSCLLVSGRCGWRPCPWRWCGRWCGRRPRKLNPG